MKLLISILFFLLLSILGCTKEECYECTTHKEITMTWEQYDDMPVSGYPRITDSTFIFCGISDKEAKQIEYMNSDYFWYRDGILYFEEVKITKCVKQ